uniref:5'-nucleotidase surE n=1 Tax=Rhizophora mucronata TaxID=61149 RepID=A0A2P2KBT2_RHIMU
MRMTSPVDLHVPDTVFTCHVLPGVTCYVALVSQLRALKMLFMNLLYHDRWGGSYHMIFPTH